MNQYLNSITISRMIILSLNIYIFLWYYKQINSSYQIMAYFEPSKLMLNWFATSVSAVTSCPNIVIFSFLSSGIFRQCEAFILAIWHALQFGCFGKCVIRCSKELASGKFRILVSSTIASAFFSASAAVDFDLLVLLLTIGFASSSGMYHRCVIR